MWCARRNLRTLVCQTHYSCETAALENKTMRSHVARCISKRPRVAVRSRSTHTSVMMIHLASVLESFKMRFIKAASSRNEGGPDGRTRWKTTTS
ncbi:hypothetical protein PsorP6_006441 [Peronosclerospora sorghi]|uniref:Uncharacterized protein n=1 Tax=Peronosclerospora sorghi TaxID=230839 RepID=A0ACC0W414_9STRA|nr:hypothetical protein PsorP6_006441 [Peronosclerospora sorghi]